MPSQKRNSHIKTSSYHQTGNGRMNGMLINNVLLMIMVQSLLFITLSEFSTITGWEYCFGPGMGSWNPSERANHHTRRRRWVRTRRRTSSIRKPSIVEVQSANVYINVIWSYSLTCTQTKNIDSEGWEYARFHDSTYHSTDGMMFLARRQRLVRKMRPVAGSTKPPIFYLKDNKIQLVPRMFVLLEGEQIHKYN